MQRPPVVPEVTLELPTDGGDRVADERPCAGVVAVDGLEQTQVRHLVQVVLGLAGAAVARGQSPGHRHMAPRELLTGLQRPFRVTREQLLVGLLKR